MSDELKGNCWITRDRDEEDGHTYLFSPNIVPSSRMLLDRDNVASRKVWNANGAVNRCDRVMHKLFPEVYLKPGEGPRRIQIDMNFVPKDPAKKAE